MKTFKRLLKSIFFGYLIYVFISFFLLFKFYPSENKNKDNNHSSEITEQLNNKEEVALIESPKDAISVRLDLIKKAESKIDLAYYRWSDGEVSDLMLTSILEAADRGIEVRILLDGIVQLTNINKPINNVFLAFKSHPNIQIKLYEPFNPLLPIAWNHRMHDKMMLIDQEFALMGGRNIQDRFYLEDADRKGLVQDREVLIYNKEKRSTSAVHQMENYYGQLWNYQHTKEKYPTISEKQKRQANKQLDELRESHEEVKNEFIAQYFPKLEIKDWAQETLPTKSVSFVSNSLGRMNQNPKTAKAILTLSEEAKESIFIQSPYFIPSHQLLKETENFDLRPELTTLFTNSKAASPNIFAMASYQNHRPELVDSGARIVEYQGPGSTHAKSSIFDEEISLVGTFNIDPRSAYINTESVVIIDSEAFAEELKEAIAVDFNHSLEVAEDYSYIEEEDINPSQLSTPRKILIWFLSFFTPIFENLL